VKRHFQAKVVKYKKLQLLHQHQILHKQTSQNSSWVVRNAYNESKIEDGCQFKKSINCQKFVMSQKWLDQSPQNSKFGMVKPCWRFVHSFFLGRSPAYSGLQRVAHQQAQCACPWATGGELVGVWCVWGTCSRGGLSRHEQLVRYLLMRPVKALFTVWLAWLELMQRQPTSTCAALTPADAYAALPEVSHIFLLGSRRHLDVANQDVGNGHRF